MQVSGDDVRWQSDGRVIASGHVKVSYQGYTITADRLEADTQTGVAAFERNIAFASTNGISVKGNHLKVNLKSRDWSLQNAKSRMDPAASQGQITVSLFAQGAQVTGKKDVIRVDSGSLTTCDLEHPHYEFKAHDIEIYPTSRIVAHKVTFYALGRGLVTLPVVVIPLHDLSRNFFPQIGSSAEEGAYLKTSTAYLATASSQGFFQLDFMQYRGIGVGLDNTYRLPGGGGGLASIYYLADNVTGANDITGKLRHEQKFGGIDVNITGDYRTNSYLYFPSTTASNWQVSLTNGKGPNVTSLSVQNNSTCGSTSTDNFMASLRHTQQLTKTLSSVFSVDTRALSGTGMPGTNRDLESDLELRNRGKLFDLTFIANKTFNLNPSSGLSFGGLNRLPELRLDTDSYRLGSGYFLGIPSRVSIIAGRYDEISSGVNRDRLLFQYDMLGRRINVGDLSDLNITAGVRQAFYGADMAQYVLKSNDVFTTRYSDDLRSRISYDYQQPEGYSPFLFDTTTRSDILRGVLDYQHNKDLRWSLFTGYDLGNPGARWQDLAVRLTAHPDAKYSYSLSTGYDLNGHQWRTLIGQVQTNIPKIVSLGLGTSYDIEQGKINLARGTLDLHLNKEWRIETIASWNSGLRAFDYRAIRLTKDLHCMEASISFIDDPGVRNDKGIMFDIRIKGLPFIDRFGLNQYGQNVDTSMGQYLY